MNKKILILTSISISTSVFAQDISTIRNISNIYDNNITSGTARYTAMAGAMGALGGDISSLNSNPAGLGVFITSDINAGLSINSTNTETALSNSSVKKNTDNTRLGQVGGVLSFQTGENSSWKFVNIGMNYVSESVDNMIQSPQNHNISEPIYSNGKIVDHNLYSGHLYETIGERSKFNIGVGGNYENKIFIGASVNLFSSNIKQYDESLISSQKNPNTGLYYKKQDTPFKEESGGFSLSVGLIGKLSNQLRLGASFESPVWYNIDREYIHYNNNAGNISSASYSENRNLRTPSKLTLSGAFIPNKNFAFNIDYKMDLGKPNFSKASGAETQLNDFYQSTYKARHEVRAGAEYRIKGFRIRGGYAFTISPFHDYTYASAFNTDGTIAKNGKVSNYIVGKSQIISGGIGYDFKSFYLDAAYQHQTLSYSNPFFDGIYVLSGTNGSYFNHGTSIISDAKTTRGNFMFTLGWKF